MTTETSASTRGCHARVGPLRCKRAAYCRHATTSAAHRLQSADTLLLAALRDTPRPYRLPPLPRDADSARAAGVDAALAFAIEAARAGAAQDSPPDDGIGELFTWALAQLIRAALAAEGGDPAFQALVLRAQHAEVEEHVRLEAQAHADRRAVRTATDAIAHPGKLRGFQPGALRDALSRLHHLAGAGPWTHLRQQAESLLAMPDLDAQMDAALRAMLSSPALERLERGSALLPLHGVRRYRALCEQRGPLAGSHAAAAQGRASARAGDAAEEATLRPFRRIAALLEQHDPAGARHRVLGSLRTPRGFPGDVGKAKDEWDAVIVRATASAGAVAITLLAEVKASPTAATSDFPRLLRGLQRLAHASAGTVYRFRSSDGEVGVRGDSLRRLHPHGGDLPAEVIYCCSAAAEPQPQLLSAATKAVLSSEAASIAFAQRIAAGASPPQEDLLPVWEDLATEPRLRSALHQYETASAARAAMVHPEDLLAAVERYAKLYS